MSSGKVSCEELQELIDSNNGVPFVEQTILLVDCRPFFTFNDCHIRDAVNVFCSKFLLRRKGHLLEKIFTDCNVRERLKNGQYFHIVLYEENDIVPNDSVASLVANCLEDEAQLSCIYLLEGGFCEFNKRYPHLCNSSNTSISAISEKVSELSLERYDSGLAVSETSHSGNIDRMKPLTFPTYTWPFKVHQQNGATETQTCQSTTNEIIHKKKSSLQLNLQSTITTSTTTSEIHSTPLLKGRNHRIGLLNITNETLLNNLDPVDEDELLEPSELTPYLFIGSQTHSNSLDILSRLGITAILNVSSCCPNYFESEFLYKRIFLRDTGDGDIQSVMNESIDFINQIRESHGKVLVHCRAGMSRSATMCIAYLIKHNHWSMDQAYEFVKSRRPQIAPNFSFMVQMMEFEKKLCRTSVTDELSSPTSSSTLSSSASSSSSEASTPSSASSSIS